QLNRELVDHCRKRIDYKLRRRNDLVVGIAEFVAARADISVAQFVNRDRKGILGDGGDHLATFNLVSRGGSLVAVAHEVTHAARGVGAVANVPDDALPFFRIGDAELLTRHAIAYPEGLTNDECLQLSIT